jgi:hypothetical protein
MELCSRYIYDMERWWHIWQDHSANGYVNCYMELGLCYGLRWYGLLVLNVLIVSMHGLINGVNGGLVGMYC